MTYVIAEIDGPVEVFQQANVFTIIDTDLTEVSHSITDSAFTNYYTVSMASDVYFRELMVFLDNDHILRITVGSTVIFEESIKALKDVGLNTDIYKISDIVKYSDNAKVIAFNLNNFKGQTLLVDQKRRSGTGDVTLKGIITTYGVES